MLLQSHRFHARLGLVLQEFRERLAAVVCDLQSARLGNTQLWICCIITALID